MTRPELQVVLPLLLLVAPGLAGRSLQCAYRAPRLGISTQGPLKGLARITARGLDPVHSRYAVILAPFDAGLTPGDPP